MNRKPPFPFTISRPPRYVLSVAAICLLALPTVQASPWSKVKAPASGPSNAIGGAANGCIAGAATLPSQGEGYVSIRRHRNRYYGHPETVRLVKDLGGALSKRTDDLVMVGDLSQPRGGLMSSSHRSHQNGLDVDIWFGQATSARAADREHPEERDPRSMVAPGGLDLGDAWGAHQRFLLKTAAEDRRVDRIFVNPAIKRALCMSENGDRKWLRKLRAWWGHDAHFHVRLKCPKGSPNCKQQTPIPADDGCGKELAWWFSEEARSPSKKTSKKPKPRPPMPAACKALLAGS
ncbi:MAG: penicillin-insensitive murein endopeptidase [Pseudomonadota bacterium]|nr:penicillin-insensitive murein endopeptidase [Pseudomonadota bacterium]